MKSDAVAPTGVVALLACAVIAGCRNPSASPEPLPPAEETGPIVSWSTPVDGLAVGIEPRGPVVTLHADPPATITVRLRNTTAAEILWSDSMSAWSVSFEGPGWKPPEPFTDPKPPPYMGEPLLLGPHAEATLEIPIVRAYVLWPPVPAGVYTLAVSYAPAHLRTFSRGDPGTRPFDDPRFWSGTIESPAIELDVRGGDWTGISRRARAPRPSRSP